MSSRLIIKNLPKHLTDERFREHFSSQGGDVTDAKIMKTSQGESRKFGYIGFRKEKDAKKALKYFQNSFIDTSKIIVEVSKPVGDSSLPRAWSQHSRPGQQTIPAGASLEKAKADAARAQELEERKVQLSKEIEKKKEHVQRLYKDQNDDKLQEFLETMQGRARTQTWANDDMVGREAPAKAPKVAAAKAKTRVVAVANRKAGGEGLLISKTHVTFSDDESDADGAAATDDENAEPKEEDAIVHGEEVSDLDYLKSRMTATTTTFTEDESIKTHPDAAEGAAEASPDTEMPDADATEAPSPFAPAIASGLASNQELILDTGRLFLRNLSYGCNEEDLRKLFERFGPLSEVHLPISKESRQPKGFGYILFLMPEHALDAYVALDGQFFQGRLLHILPGKEKPAPVEVEDEDGTVKSQREKKRIATAGDSFNWNTLYMNPDAVMDSIAEKLKVSKSDILDPESDNMAVRMALAETHVIADTKSYLASRGVDLETFSRRERSDSVILVKNIAHATTEEDLRDMFGKHGQLGRVILPPTKTLAMIEFLEPTEARAAFRHMAYKRMKNTLLYLEKAPKDVFSTEYDPSAPISADPAVSSEEKKGALEEMLEAKVTAATGAVDESEADGEGCTLFVKNLSFDTVDAGLRAVFSGVDGLKSCTIRRKPHPKNPKETLSMGFGFVEFASAYQARAAQAALQGFMLDGHALQLKASNRVSSGSDASKKKTSAKASTKLIVRNIAFEATKKDIRDLFSAYGQLKSVRLPKKFDGGHRGFAFLEFLTKQEAKNAFDSVAATHLYGRHLVLEWAEETPDEDKMRERVGLQVDRDIRGAADREKKRRRLETDSKVERGFDDSIGL